MFARVRGLQMKINGEPCRPSKVTFDIAPQTAKQEQWKLQCELICIERQREKYFSDPSIELVLQALPMLQWRRCFDCKAELLYRDNMLPACACHKCGSADTRIMTAENRLLHRMDVCSKGGAK
jgi:hypothetical protein